MEGEQWKKKVHKLNFTKIKSFCASKSIIKKVKDNLQNERKYLEITS